MYHQNSNGHLRYWTMAKSQEAYLVVSKDSRQLKMAAETGNINSGTMTHRNSNDKFGIFDDDELDKSLPCDFDNELLPEIASSGQKRLRFQLPVVGHRRNRSGSVFRFGRGRKPHICR